LEILNASYNLLTTIGKDFHGLPVLCTADLSHNSIASMTVDLVSNTRCSNHGVVGKLEIFLQGELRFSVFEFSVKSFSAHRESSFVQ
jgi:hypothetical protein